MKKLFQGRFKGVFDYLLHIGPTAAFFLLNFIAATVVAVAMAILIWFDKR